MTSAAKTSNSVRAGGVAIFLLAILALGAVFGLGTPRSPGASPRPVSVDTTSGPAVPLSWVVIVGVLEAGMLIAGTLLVLRLVRDVRRQRAIVRSAPRSDAAVERGLRAVLDAADRPTAFEAMIAAVVAATSSTSAAVILRSGRGAVEATAIVGDATSDDLVVAGVAQVLESGRPRRWVEAGTGAAGAARSFIAAPLSTGGRTVGVLVGSRVGDAGFGLYDLDVACQLAEAALPSEPALVDDVTDLPTRRRLDRDLGAGVVPAGEVGLAVVAVDHLYRLRNEFGDAAADGVLRELVAVVADAVRDGDLVYRYGEGQLGVLMLTAGADETADVAERLRVAVEAHEFVRDDGDSVHRVTVSVGTVVTDADDLGDITTRAERAVSEAERFGRNRVVALDRG